MLRVGIDAWNLPYDRRGIGRYVRSILHAWNAAGAAVATTLVVPDWPAWTVAARYRDAAQTRVHRVRSRRALRRNVDVLWFPFNGPSWLEFAVPSVATLHDASTFVLPGFDEAARATFRNAAARCDAILTDSNFSRGELVRELGLAPANVHAIPLGVGMPLPVSHAAIDTAAFGRFVLFVGESEPRKGLGTLFEAMALLRARIADAHLVVVGKLASEPPSHSSVTAHYLGHVDDATLTALYRACTAFAYPSRYEGFGLPVLEAMNYGAPVVASNATAIPEAGGDAALYVPPDDPHALADALAQVFEDEALRADLRARGTARCAVMTWDATARATLAVLRAVGGHEVFARKGEEQGVP